MAGRVPESEYFGRQKAERERTKRDVEDLQRIDGSQFLRLYEKMTALFAGLNDTVTSVVQSLTFTRAEINSKIASPGGIAPTTVAASGAISTTGLTVNGNQSLSGGLIAPGVRNNPISTYRTMVMDDAGNCGYSSSTERVKQDISDAVIDVAAFMSVRPRSFRYIAEVEALGDDAVADVGFIAEELIAAGITQPVFTDAEGLPEGVNYDKTTPFLWGMLQIALTRIDALERAQNGAE